MIYAQRPDATACASMEQWNEDMRRWVKAGSKGIALIRKDCQRRCGFVVFRRTENVEKWRVKVYSL